MNDYFVEEKQSTLHKNYSSVDSLEDYYIEQIITEFNYKNSARGKCDNLINKVFCCCRR